MPKKIFTQELEGTRRGRPRIRWKEEVEIDLQVLGVRRWRELVADRRKWKGIVRQAKAHSGRRRRRRTRRRRKKKKSKKKKTKNKKKNEWSCICAPPCSFMVCTGTTLPLQQNSQNFPFFFI